LNNYFYGSAEGLEQAVHETLKELGQHPETALSLRYDTLHKLRKTAWNDDDVVDNNDRMYLLAILPGDFITDGFVNASDINELSAALHESSNDTKYDLDHSGTVDSADKDYLIHTLLLTEYGDANLDRMVNFSDYLALSQNFGSSVSGVGSAQGDFNGDGQVDFSDYLLLSQNFGFGE